MFLEHFDFCLDTLLFIVVLLRPVIRRVDALTTLGRTQCIFAGAHILIRHLKVEDSLFQVQEVVVLEPGHLLHFSGPDGRDVALDAGCGDDGAGYCVLVLVEEGKLV